MANDLTDTYRSTLPTRGWFRSPPCLRRKYHAGRFRAGSPRAPSPASSHKRLPKRQRFVAMAEGLTETCRFTLPRAGSGAHFSTVRLCGSAHVMRPFPLDTSTYGEYHTKGPALRRVDMDQRIPVRCRGCGVGRRQQGAAAPTGIRALMAHGNQAPGQGIYICIYPSPQQSHGTCI